MPARYFTPETANEALAEVRPLAERMVQHHRAIELAQAHQREYAGRIAGNGGGLDAAKLKGLQQSLEGEVRELARCVERINALGVLVKDTGRGLVDFPARREGEDVLLCWHVGEDRVAYWHGLDEGYAGRKPLDAG